MPPADFTPLLEERLRLLGARFSQTDLQEFVAVFWPRMRGDPNVGFWAEMFLDTGKADGTA